MCCTVQRIQHSTGNFGMKDHKSYSKKINLEKVYPNMWTSDQQVISK